MISYRNIEPELDFVEEARSCGILLPSLRVNTLLDTRMSRFNTSLSFDHEALYDGASKLEIENPITVTVEPLGKDADTETPATLDYKYSAGFSKADVTVSIPHHVPAAPEKLSEVDRKLNIALWTGILVSDRLLDDKSTYKSEKKHSSSMYNLKGVVTAGSITVANVVTMNEIVDYLPLSLTMTGMTLLSGSLGAFKSIKREIQSLEDYVGSKFSDRIQEIASAYPVLSHLLEED